MAEVYHALADPARFPRWRGAEPLAPRLAGRSGPPAVLDRLPYAALAALLDRTSATHTYHVAPEVRAALDGAAGTHGPGYVAGFFAWLYGSFDERFVASGLPPVFHGHFVDAFHRVLDEIDAGTFCADLSRDVCEKDLALARLAALPAMACLLMPDSGVPLRHLPRGGPRLWGTILAAGARRPAYEIHLHDPMLPAYFSPAGWAECFRLAAVLLRSRPEVHGLVGTSWLYDPALGRVSPKLAYMRDGPLSGGATFYPVPRDPQGESYALFKSPTRRALHEAGQYAPRVHAMLWPRDKLIAAWG